MYLYNTKREFYFVILGWEMDYLFLLNWLNLLHWRKIQFLLREKEGPGKPFASQVTYENLRSFTVQTL